MELNIIFIIILGVVSVVYLVTLSFKPGAFQYILKCCLMPLVLAVYISTAGFENIYWLVFLALLFAWIGDVVLLRIADVLWFKLGLVSFLIGHIFYVIAMYKFAVPFNIPVLIISIVVSLSFCLAAYKIIKPDKQMRIPVIAYESIIMVMAIFALQLFMAHQSTFGILVFAGSICFVVSDTLLALKTFRGFRVFFAIMITYIAAQFLIAYGFTMMP